MPAISLCRPGPPRASYVLNGEKSSISMADQADATLSSLPAPARDEDGARGVSAFLVDRCTPGVKPAAFPIWAARRSAAARSSSMTSRCRAPTGSATRARGFVQVMQGFDFSRALIGLQCLAAAQASRSTKPGAMLSERKAFGAPLSRNQGVTFPLAEHETYGRGGAPALLPHPAPARRRPAAHGGGRDVQVAGPRRPPSTSSINAC